MSIEANFVVTPHKILYGKPGKNDSFENIMLDNNIHNGEDEIIGIFVKMYIESSFDLDDWIIYFKTKNCCGYYTESDHEDYLSKWKFRVCTSHDIPYWFNEKDAEELCRKNIVDWFNSRCIQNDIVIESGYYFVFDDITPHDSKITINGGFCNVHGNSKPTIIDNRKK